jgi:hypothetical protein
MTDEADKPRGRCVGKRVLAPVGASGSRGLSRRCSDPNGRGAFTGGAADRGGGTRGATREGGASIGGLVKHAGSDYSGIHTVSRSIEK